MTHQTSRSRFWSRFVDGVRCSTDTNIICSLNRCNSFKNNHLKKVARVYLKCAFLRCGSKCAPPPCAHFGHAQTEARVFTRKQLHSPQQAGTHTLIYYSPLQKIKIKKAASQQSRLLLGSCTRINRSAPASDK